MKSKLLSCSILFAALIVISFKSKAQCPLAPFAVVELFTSQGCSYCPAADEALDSVIAAEKNSGRNVICIEEHVTYWNGSWVDPFGDAQFSPRQTVYCQYMGVQKGTPECFVNGKTIVAPSPTIPGINTSVNTQLAAAATAGVCLTMLSAANDPVLNVAYNLSGNYTGANLIVCLVEDGLVSHPNAGENQGATLNESGVSRKFIITPISAATGTVSITPPANCVRSKSQIVAYVQNPTTMAIRGATRGIDLSAVTTAVENTEASVGMNVYPNPATSSVMVEGLSNADKVHYSLCNIMGAEVQSGDISSGNSTFSGKIELNNMSNGMYLLKVTDGEKTFIKKISKN